MRPALSGDAANIELLQGFAAAGLECAARWRSWEALMEGNACQMGFAYLAGRIDSSTMIPALFLIVSVVVYRIATGLLIHSGTTWLSNFAPLAAIALCGAAYFPRKMKFSVPLIALFISDAVLDYHYGVSLFDLHILSRYLALVLVGCLGVLLQNRATLRTLLPASIAGSVIFYLVTNVFSWLTDPGYIKTFGGLVQALSVGLPAYSATPTWMFFRNSLLSDLFFTLLFVAAIHFGRNTGRARAGAALPRVA
jgi:Family of unknown function (DUF6580)